MRITIYGDPVAKQRPRVANGHAYTPRKTKDYEYAVAQGAKSQHIKTFTCGVELYVTAYLKTPKSANKRDRAAMERGEIRPLKRPDVDNLAKAVMDGLNGVAYEDDKQVARLITEKYYSEIPRVEIEVRAL